MSNNLRNVIFRSHLFLLLKSNSILFSILFLYYIWSASNGRFDALAWSGTPEGYLNSLADAFRQGHTHLLQKPDVALISLSDPYDPVQRATLPSGTSVMHDASLYDGKYFLYFTPVLSLLFLLPFRLLTGHFMSEILLGSLLAFLAATLIAGTIMKVLKYSENYKYSKRAEQIVIISAFSITGFPYVLRRIAFYELSILSGVLFLSLFLYAIAKIVLNRTNLPPSNGLIVASGLFAGLAIWSRPHMLIYFVGFLPVFIYVVVKSKPNQKSSIARYSAKKIMILFTPVLSILSLMAFYNFTRFNSVFEFGISYILGPADLREIGLFNPRNLPMAVFGYLFTVPDFNFTFPFVHLRAQSAPIAFDFPFGGENLMGLFALPTSLLLLSIFQRSRIESKFWQRNDYFFALSLFLGGLGILGVLSLTALTASRYTLEFFPAYTIIVTCIFAPAFANKGSKDNYFMKGNQYESVVRGIAKITILLQIFSGIEGYGSTFQNISPNQFQFLKGIFEGLMHILFDLVGLPTPN